jgi:hypothetical protein
LVSEEEMKILHFAQSQQKRIRTNSGDGVVLLGFNEITYTESQIILD